MLRVFIKYFPLNMLTVVNFATAAHSDVTYILFI